MRYLKIDLISSIFNYIDEEKINFKLNQDYDLELFPENSDKSIVLEISMKPNLREILYKIYLPEFEEQTNVMTINNVDQILFLTNEDNRWKIKKDIENIWLIVDEIEYEEQNNKFILKQREIEKQRI